MERKEYEMTEADLAKILEACKPVPYMVFGGMPPRSPQESVNAAWAELGRRLGFDHMTVAPTGRGDRFFSAVPNASGRLQLAYELACQMLNAIGWDGTDFRLRDPVALAIAPEVERRNRKANKEAGRE
jgi:hypothetical protein